jgi:hypothetical protein
MANSIRSHLLRWTGRLGFVSYIIPSKTYSLRKIYTLFSGILRIDLPLSHHPFNFLFKLQTQ